MSSFHTKPRPRLGCALLLRHMYGTDGAAEGWQDECSFRPIEAGFVQGMASPCVFNHPGEGMAVSVHGDNFTAVGPKSELDRFEKTESGNLGPEARNSHM